MSEEVGLRAPVLPLEGDEALELKLLETIIIKKEHSRTWRYHSPGRCGVGQGLGGGRSARCRREAARERAGCSLCDTELLRLGEDAVEMRRVLDEVNLVAGAGNPSSTGRVHHCGTVASNHEGIKDLLDRGIDLLMAMQRNNEHLCISGSFLFT